MQVTRNKMIYLWDTPDQPLSNWMEYWTLTYDKVLNELQYHMNLNNEFWVEYYTVFIMFINKKLNEHIDYHELDNNTLNTITQFTEYDELEKLESKLNNIYVKHASSLFNDLMDEEEDDEEEMPNWNIMPAPRFI